MNWFIGFPIVMPRAWKLPSPPAKVRCFAASDLHVTCVFLGAVAEGSARAAWSVATNLMRPKLARREVTFSHSDLLGVSALSAVLGESRAAFEPLIAAARGPVSKIAGVKPDDRPPLPHMTFARIARRASAADTNAALRWAQAIDVKAWRAVSEELALYTWSDDRDASLFRIVERA